MISVLNLLIEQEEQIISNPLDQVKEFTDNDGGKQDSDELKKVDAYSKTVNKQNQDINRNIQG
jgi:hypothetical protein